MEITQNETKKREGRERENQASGPQKGHIPFVLPFVLLAVNVAARSA